MNGLSRFCWIASAVYLILGMIFGIWMSVTGDHSYAPAHAHLNLIGGILMALFGTFYALCPGAAKGVLAKLHIASANMAAITITPGIIMAMNGTGEALAKIGSLLALLTLGLFLVILIRDSKPASA
jgi:preprotein translocase subunit SecG